MNVHGRSMVLVSKRFPDGSIQYCGVHDVMRNLAINKAKEINFLMVCSKKDDWEWCNKARRVAIHYSNKNEPIGSYASPNVRSLLFFGESSEVDCSEYRVLRVLGSMKGRVKFQSFRGSPHLRYLKLDDHILEREREFGEWIEGMKYLETINLHSSEHADLSYWIYQIKTLRHVLLSPLPMKTRGPPTPVNLRYLQTIRNVRYHESWETSGLPNIPEVRELHIQIFRNRKDPRFPLPKSRVATVATLLHRLEHIVYLKMQGDVIDLQRMTKEGFTLNKNLKSLVLINDHQDHSDDTSHLPHEGHRSFSPTFLIKRLIKRLKKRRKPEPPKEPVFGECSAQSTVLSSLPTSQNCKERRRSFSLTFLIKQRKKQRKTEPAKETLLGECSAQSTVLSSMVLSSLPAHLTELRLEGYKFGSDPMLVLEKLGSLNTLWIRGTSEQNPLSIKCTAGGFKQLEKLVLKELNLVIWEIDSGAMPMLKGLAVKSCPLDNEPFEKSKDLISRLQYLKWEPEPKWIDNLKEQRPDLQTWNDNDIED